MPKRTDIQTIFIIGSGPIRIGQACEFDYSGTQACKALKSEGYKTVLINSNLATIMTDGEMAEKIYIEPITSESIEKIFQKEKVDALLPTIGGQTSLNMAMELEEKGILKKYNVELIGASIDAIKKSENREIFKNCMDELGFNMAKAFRVKSINQSFDCMKHLSYPVIVRPSFTLGGTGGGMAYNKDDLARIVGNGIAKSMVGEVVIEQSLKGWKEYELEVMKDMSDNVVIICSIENLDPMGIHTGDSITVAPQQTLSDKEYQKLRDMGIAIIRKIGVSTGGANIQFAVHPITREVIVIEMNPRVSRSSALASKATGFPIAKIAAKLAVGLSLDEIKNDITKSTPACFEPSIDYVVTKMPRFAFEKFRETKDELGVQMLSVGEAMALGKTFCSSLQKSIRGLEINKHGMEGEIFSTVTLSSLDKQTYLQLIKDKKDSTQSHITRITEDDSRKIYLMFDLMHLGVSDQSLIEISKIEPWFIRNIRKIFDMQDSYFCANIHSLKKEDWLKLKQEGFSDFQLSCILRDEERKAIDVKEIRKIRNEFNVKASFASVDSCAAEFVAETPYFYSCYDEGDDLGEYLEKLKKAAPSNENKTVVILGSGPNRIGQGIEFDYMCVKACLSLRQKGYTAVMINCNPETVSTDYDISNILFFEALTTEDVIEVVNRINPLGVMIHFGGQTPLKIAKELVANNIPILGTSQESIEATENRETFAKILKEANVMQPESRHVFNWEEAKKILGELGTPLMTRPSYVLGGQAMQIVWKEDEFADAFATALEASMGHGVLIDKYLQNAIEFDIDCISDKENVIVAGILEHIEQAGIHSGDSACLCPPKNLSAKMQNKIIDQAKKLTLALEIQGPINLQLAIQDNQLYCLEANPRGSRTIPFVSKALNTNWIDIAVKAMLGEKISKEDLALSFENKNIKKSFVKEAHLPFSKFPDEDTLLGPEMKSTGEVMGVGINAAEAFYKSQLGVGEKLPNKPGDGILLSLKKNSRENFLAIAKKLVECEFHLLATNGTHRYLAEHGIKSEKVNKLGEGRPDLRDKIINDEIKLIFNTPESAKMMKDDKYLRSVAKQKSVCVVTTLRAMELCAEALYEAKKREFDVFNIQEDYF